MTVLVLDLRADDPATYDSLEATLQRVFEETQQAVLDGRPIVYLVHEPAIWGQASPLRCALTTGVLGGMRSAAVELARKGQAANAVATGDEGEDRVSRCVEFLSVGDVTGQVLMCGTTHLGRPAA